MRKYVTTAAVLTAHELDKVALRSLEKDNDWRACEKKTRPPFFHLAACGRNGNKAAISNLRKIKELRKMTSAGNDKPGVVAMPPIIFIIFLALGIVVNLIQPLGFIYGTARFASGIIILLISGIIVLSAQIRMKKAGTNIDVRRPSTTVVTDGIYSYTRNPMYLAMVILLIALAFLLNNLWIIIVIPLFMAVIHKGVIMREEAYLERKFGSHYREYKKRVRRWI